MNPVFVISVRLLGLCFSIVAAALLARWLGPERFGEWQFIVSVAAVFTVLLTMGLPTVIRRDGAVPAFESSAPVASIGSPEADNVASQYLAAFAIIAASVVPVALLATFLGAFIGIEGFVIAVVWSLGGAVLAIASNQLRALFLPIRAEAVMILGASMPIIVAVAFLALFENQIKALEPEDGIPFLSFCGLSLLFNGAIVLYVWSKLDRRRDKSRTPVVSTVVRYSSGLFRRSLAFFPLILVFGLIHYGSSIALGLVSEQSEVGFYNIALALSTALIALITAYYASAGPHLASAYKTEDWETFLTTFRETRRTGIVLVAASLVAAFSLGEWFIATVYGPDYLRAYDYLLLLLAPIGISLPLGAISETLQMTGRQGIETRVRVAQLFGSVALAGIGYWIEGAWGLVVGFVVARCLAAIVLALYFYLRFYPRIVAEHRLA